MSEKPKMTDRKLSITQEEFNESYLKQPTIALMRAHLDGKEIEIAGLKTELEKLRAEIAELKKQLEAVQIAEEAIKET